MKYNEETIKTDFTFREDYDNKSLIELLNLYYDKVKKMPIDEVKKLLPIDHIGYNGTYLEDWMVKKCDANEYFPFTITGEIWDWKGDRDTTNVIRAAANSEEELYTRLLMQYLNYLLPDGHDEAKQITNVINKY